MDGKPITPPPELVQKWCAHSDEHENYDQFWSHIATRAARWGADQELEACCEWVKANAAYYWDAHKGLRSARRPQLSLKEQSLALIDTIQGNKEMWQTEELDVVRRALEQLPE